jgi:hypothetical protein
MEQSQPGARKRRKIALALLVPLGLALLVPWTCSDVKTGNTHNRPADEVTRLRETEEADRLLRMLQQQAPDTDAHRGIARGGDCAACHR